VSRAAARWRRFASREFECRAVGVRILCFVLRCLREMDFWTLCRDLEGIVVGGYCGALEFFSIECKLWEQTVNDQSLKYLGIVCECAKLR